MNISYDKEADALNIVFRKGVVAKTLSVAPEILVDVDKNGSPLYLEILGVTEKIGKKSFQNLTLGSKTVRLSSLVV